MKTKVVKVLACTALGCLVLTGCQTHGGGAGRPGVDRASHSEEILDSFAVLGAWDIDLLGSPGTLKSTQAGLLAKFNIDAKPPKDKCVVSIPVQISLAAKSGVLVDIDNRCNGPMSAAFAVAVRQGGYFESRSQAMKPGLNRDVFFGLRSSTYKSAVSQWRYEVRPRGLARTRKLSLLIYARGEGEVMFKNFRIASDVKPQAAQRASLLPTTSGGKWGYADGAGKMVIAPRFDRAYPFSEGLALVMLAGRYGYIRPGGSMVIRAQFDEARTFSAGRGCVKVGKKWGYIDKAGRLAIDARFSSASPFADGLARIETGDKHGYIDAAGKVVIQPQYDSALDFSEDLAAVRTGTKWGFVGTSGKMVIKPRFEGAYGFAEGLAGVKLNGKWGFVDRTGGLKVQARFDLVRSFSEGVAPVEEDGKWGYLRQYGNFAVEPRFDMAEPFSEGLAAVMIDGRWGYIDGSGLISIAPVYDLAMPFANGVALVQIVDRKAGTLSGYIDEAGQYVVGPDR